MRANVEGVASNPSTPEELLLRILAADCAGAAAVATRPELPDPIYDAVVAHRDLDIRGLLARSAFAPARQRARLADDSSAVIRLFVAAGPITFRTKVEPLPDHTYRELVADPSPAVRSAACLTWPNPPAAVLDLLLHDPDPETRTAAATRSWRRLPHLLTQIATARDDLVHLWSEAIATAPLDPATVAALLSRDEWVRRLLAENPYLPGEAIARLIADRSHDVRVAVSMRQELGDRVREIIAVDIDPAEQITPAFWPSTTDNPALMRRAVESTHLGLRRSAAYNPRLPRNLVHRLAADEDAMVRLILCETHPYAPADVLWEVLRETRMITRADLITHPNFPIHRLRELAASPDPTERSLVVHDPIASTELIERLSHDIDPRVRRATAADPRLSRRRLLELLDDPTTSYGAVRNPTLPLPIMESVLSAAGIA